MFPSLSCQGGKSEPPPKAFFTIRLSLEHLLFGAVAPYLWQLLAVVEREALR